MIGAVRKDNDNGAEWSNVPASLVRRMVVKPDQNKMTSTPLACLRSAVSIYCIIFLLHKSLLTDQPDNKEPDQPDYFIIIYYLLNIK